MTTYRFTGATPLVFTTLSYGPGVIVEHTKTDEPLPPAPHDGATVILIPGDFLTIEGTIASHWLEPVDLGEKRGEGEDEGDGEGEPAGGDLPPENPPTVPTPAAAENAAHAAAEATPEADPGPVTIYPMAPAPEAERVPVALPTPPAAPKWPVASPTVAPQSQPLAPYVAPIIPIGSPAPTTAAGE